VDSFQLGYPRYSALLSTHPAFFVFRRFGRVRMRLLLLKQNEVLALQEALDKLDEEETNRLSLSCFQRDSNRERQQILERLTKSLEEYDKLLAQAYQAFNLPDTSERDVTSLKNWVHGNSCIARSEATYLNQKDDLASLTAVHDDTIFQTESILEDFLPSQRFCSRSRRNHKYTTDPHIFIFGPCLQRVSRGLIAWVTILTLLVPIAILNSLSQLVGRFITIIIAAGVVVFAMSLLTRARTLEVFMAGTAYAAVLVVFTSSNNGLSAGLNFSCPPSH
ncbi:uncharacterized protein K441DRAFT_554126, partial [Cenococcum geophilum 1.58]|uniref:uncharacterized protein n=1 Tax=Cenococcum geophilum 1.58 TaxID=794803 RepID=UPI00358E584C